MSNAFRKYLLKDQINRENLVEEIIADVRASRDPQSRNPPILPHLVEEQHAALLDYFHTLLQKGAPLDQTPFVNLVDFSPEMIRKAAEQIPYKTSAEHRREMEEAASRRSETAQWKNIFTDSENKIFLALDTSAHSVNERIEFFIDKHNVTAASFEGDVNAIEGRKIRRDPANPSSLQTLNPKSQKWETGPRLGSFLYKTGEWELFEDFKLDNNKKGPQVDAGPRRYAALREHANRNYVAADSLNPDSLRILVSRDPQLIGEMSSGQRWLSCMGEGQENFRFVSQDVEAGTLVALLVSEEDPEGKYALMRCLLKPYLNEQGQMILLPGHVYAAGHWKSGARGHDRTIPAFSKSLLNFCAALNEGKTGTFKMDQRLYADGQTTTISLENMTADKLADALGEYHDNLRHDLEYEYRMFTDKRAKADLISDEQKSLVTTDVDKILGHYKTIVDALSALEELDLGAPKPNTPRMDLRGELKDTLDQIGKLNPDYDYTNARRSDALTRRPLSNQSGEDFLERLRSEKQNLFGYIEGSESWNKVEKILRVIGSELSAMEYFVRGDTPQQEWRKSLVLVLCEELQYHTDGNFDQVMEEKRITLPYAISYKLGEQHRARSSGDLEDLTASSSKLRFEVKYRCSTELSDTSSQIIRNRKRYPMRGWGRGDKGYPQGLENVLAQHLDPAGLKDGSSSLVMGQLINKLRSQGLRDYLESFRQDPSQLGPTKDLKGWKRSLEKGVFRGLSKTNPLRNFIPLAGLTKGEQAIREAAENELLKNGEHYDAAYAMVTSSAQASSFSNPHAAVYDLFYEQPHFYELSDTAQNPAFSRSAKLCDGLKAVMPDTSMTILNDSYRRSLDLLLLENPKEFDRIEQGLEPFLAPTRNDLAKIDEQESKINVIRNHRSLISPDKVEAMEAFLDKEGLDKKIVQTERKIKALQNPDELALGFFREVRRTYLNIDFDPRDLLGMAKTLVADRYGVQEKRTPRQAAKSRASHGPAHHRGNPSSRGNLRPQHSRSSRTTQPRV